MLWSQYEPYSLCNASSTLNLWHEYLGQLQRQIARCLVNIYTHLVVHLKLNRLSPSFFSQVIQTLLLFLVFFTYLHVFVVLFSLTYYLFAYDCVNCFIDADFCLFFIWTVGIIIVCFLDERLDSGLLPCLLSVLHLGSLPTVTVTGSLYLVFNLCCYSTL